MAKSVGNVVTIRDAIEEWGRETVLLLFLGSHWRKPMEFSEETLQQARAQLQSFRDAPGGGEADWQELVAALDDDFNTPEALAVLHRWRAAGARDLVERALAIFGIGLVEAEAPQEVVRLAERRIAARAARDFDEADRLRAAIEAAGWEVRDVPDGFRLVAR
jgi:cysteinyl-tRNA synthetase